MDKCKGMLVGTTNPLFLNFPKAKADLVINLDKDTVDFPNEKVSGQLIKICRTHTNYEKKLVAQIIKQLEVSGGNVMDELLAKNTTKVTRSKTMQGGPGGMATVMREQDQSEFLGFMNLNETE